tara:strand:- start:540 stop:707 length:168 start_codon:yes stop_codon:yes gene_type:complete
MKSKEELMVESFQSLTDQIDETIRFDADSLADAIAHFVENAIKFYTSDEYNKEEE